MSNIEITDKEYIKIKTLCEFLFFDQYKETAGFLRFEKCFQPLFNNSKNISMMKIFKDIVGPKKKYITIKRFLKAYSKFKNNKNELTKDTNIFFDKLMNSILKDENDFVGKNKNNDMKISTLRTCKYKNAITLVQVLSDAQGNIHGIILTYDDAYRVKMIPKKLEDKPQISLEMKLALINYKVFKKNLAKYKKVNDDLYRDSITHIFGTINEQGFLSFLGFKSVSGKTLYVGFPDGESFLFGKFGKKIHDFRIYLNNKGITKIHPGFKENLRINYCLKNLIKFSEEELNVDEIIKDEENIKNITNEKEIDQLITTPIVEDDFFFDEKLKDEYCGNDYKEIVDQYPRKWLKQKLSNEFELINNLNEAMKKFQEEKEKSISKTTIADKSYRYIYFPFQNPFLAKQKPDDIKDIPNPFFDKNLSQSFFDELETDNQNNSYILHKTKLYKTSIMERDDIYDFKKNINKTMIIDYPFARINKNNFLSEKNYNKIIQKLSNDIHHELKRKYFNDNNIIHKIFLDRLFPYSPVHSKEIISYDNNKIKIKDSKEESTIDNQMNKDIEQNKKSLCSPALSFEKIIGNIKDKKDGESIFNKYKKFFDSATNTAKYIKKWKVLYKGLKLKSSIIYLFQTIFTVIKAINRINRKDISLSEKMKLCIILKENKNVINFLRDKNNIPEENDEEYEEEVETLIPDEHPENITSLNVLQKNLDKLKELKNLKLTNEQRQKIDLLYNLYLQQKNILIENETKNQKEQLIKNNSINYQKILDEEEEKRNKLKKEENERIAEAEHKKKLEEKEKSKDLLIGSFYDKEVKGKKIFLKQKLPEKLKIWNDDIFIADKKSLCPYDGKKWILSETLEEDDDIDEDWDSLTWCKPEKIENMENYNIFVEEPDIENVIQGNLNDCYFLSSVASLCSYESFYDKIFHIKYRTKEKAYGINFFLNGKWKLVLIDDYLPCLEKNSKPELFFGSSVIENELWVPLLEKAWAKVNGSFINIGRGGLCKETFDVLTEAYTEQIPIKFEDKEILWKKMENAIKNNYLMCLGTYPDHPDFEDVGLIDGHAYSLLKVYKVINRSGKEERLLKLRNPYGEKEFFGRWSDGSDEWTEELKEICEFPGEDDDGIFYMSFKEIKKYFICLEIAKIEPNYKTKFIKIKKEQNNKFQVIKFEIKNKSNCFINLYQKNPRIVKKNGEHYKDPVLAFLILVKKEGNDFKYIDSTSSASKMGVIIDYKVHIAIQKNLEQGTYYILSDVNYRYIYEENFGYVITTYSENEIESLVNITDIDSKEILKKAIISYFILKEKKELKSTDKNLDIYQESMIGKLPLYKYCFYNKSKFEVKIKFTVNNMQDDNCCCFYCEENENKNQNSVVKIIKPESFEICLVLPYETDSKLEFNYTVEK